MPAHRDIRDAEDRARRVVLGIVNIALAVMLVLAVMRFQGSVAQVYGDRFFYVPIVMLAIAAWRVAVGVLILIGRRRGA